MGSPLSKYVTINSELQIYRDQKVYDRFDDFYNGEHQHERETMFWGFKIVMVPWINGCFLLPDVN